MNEKQQKKNYRAIQMVTGLACLMIGLSGGSARAGNEGEQQAKQLPGAQIILQEQTHFEDAAGRPLYASKSVPVKLLVEAPEGIHRIRWSVRGQETKRSVTELPAYTEAAPTPEPTTEPAPEPTTAPEPEPTTEPEGTAKPEQNNESGSADGQKPETESKLPAEESATTEPPFPAGSPVPEDTPSPTETPVPEETPAPTETPSPTESPAPTATPTPAPSPDPEQRPPEVGSEVDGWTVEAVSGTSVTKMSRTIRVRDERNNIRVQLICEDLTGISSETAGSRFSIDRTKPAVQIAYDNNQAMEGDYFSEPRTASITVTDRNFDPAAADISCTLDGAEASPQMVWISGEADDQYTARITFAEEGIHAWTMQMTDRAGNRADAPVYEEGTVAAARFVIDRTAPEVLISYDQNDVKNGQYFNRPRTAQVTVTEAWFDPSLASVQMIRTDAGGNVEDVRLPNGGWSSDGYRNSLAILCQEDGVYTLQVSVRDRAGNQSGHPSTDGSAAAFRFVMDTAAPEVSVKGIRNGASLRKSAAAQLRVRDQNYASGEVRVLRTQMDEKEVDVTDQVFPDGKRTDSGWQGTGRIPAQTRDDDGLYVMEIRAEDLAGNVQTKTVQFTVNRYGSVFLFSEELKALQGQYVRSIDHPLMIMEYNPSPLDTGERVEITRDGLPVRETALELLRGRLNRSRAKGEGWYTRRYLLGKDQFFPEGYYRLGISASDSAGNRFSTESSGAGTIAFAVDRTPPALTSVSVERVLPVDSERAGLSVLSADSAIADLSVRSADSGSKHRRSDAAGSPGESNPNTALQLRLRMEAFDSMGLARILVRQGAAVLLEQSSFQDPVRFETRLTVGQEPLKFVLTDLAGNVRIEWRDPAALLADMGLFSTEETPEGSEDDIHELTDRTGAVPEQELLDRLIRDEEGRVSPQKIRRALEAAEQETDRRMERWFGLLCLATGLMSALILVKRRRERTAS